MLIETLFFILLSPGVLLTLPPLHNIFLSQKTSLVAVFVHGILFWLLIHYKRYLPFVRSIEGFQDADAVPVPEPLGTTAEKRAAVANAAIAKRKEQQKKIVRPIPNPT
jgi:hypothetical protein